MGCRSLFSCKLGLSLAIGSFATSTALKAAHPYPTTTTLCEEHTKSLTHSETWDDGLRLVVFIFLDEEIQYVYPPQQQRTGCSIGLLEQTLVKSGRASATPLSSLIPSV